MASKTNVVLIILAIVLLLAGFYLFLGGGSSSASALSAVGVTDPKQAAFIRLASQLGPVTLDPSVLSDPRFTGLVDIGTAVTPESAGRTDPFAPAR